MVKKSIYKKKNAIHGRNLLITRHCSIVMSIIFNIHIPRIYLKSYKCGILGTNLINWIYKIQDTRCIFRASVATLGGLSTEKSHKQVLLKSIKSMQVQVIWYMNAGDDEIETFRITITIHRWSWVNICTTIKQCGPWVLKSRVTRSCSGLESESKMPDWAV